MQGEALQRENRAPRSPKWAKSRLLWLAVQEAKIASCEAPRGVPPKCFKVGSGFDWIPNLRSQWASSVDSSSPYQSLESKVFPNS